MEQNGAATGDVVGLSSGQFNPDGGAIGKGGTDAGGVSSGLAGAAGAGAVGAGGGAGGGGGSIGPGGAGADSSGRGRSAATTVSKKRTTPRSVVEAIDSVLDPEATLPPPPAHGLPAQQQMKRDSRLLWLGVALILLIAVVVIVWLVMTVLHGDVGVRVAETNCELPDVAAARTQARWDSES